MAHTYHNWQIYGYKKDFFGNSEMKPDDLNIFCRLRSMGKYGMREHRGRKKMIRGKRVADENCFGNLWFKGRCSADAGTFPGFTVGGHDVRLAAPPEKGEWVRQLGCPFEPLGGNVTAFIDTMKDAHSIRWFVDSIRYLRKEFMSQFHLFPRIIHGVDLVVGASLVGAVKLRR